MKKKDNLMKKNQKRSIRVLSMILTILMLLTILPMSILATDTNTIQQDQFDQSSKDTYEEVNNLSKDNFIESDKQVLLSEIERPELISRSDIEANGHVSRAVELEQDLNSIALQNLDGTNTTYIFSEPVKYTDEVGIVHDKKTQLIDRIDNTDYQDDYSYTNADNDVRVYFPKSLDTDTGIVLEKNNINIELTPAASKKLVTKALPLSSTLADSGMSNAVKEVTAQTAEPVKKQMQKSDDMATKDVIDYASVFGSETTLRYQPTLNGFKEDIVLDSYDGTNEFIFSLKTNGLQLIGEDNIYYLIDPETSEKVVNMGELLVYSNGGTELSTEYDHRYQVDTITENEEYLLTIIVDENFLIDENTRYPVVVDPSFEVLSANNNIMDISVRSNGSVINDSVNDGVGNHNREKNDMRTFIKFPGLLNNAIFKGLAPYGLGDTSVQSIKLIMYSRGTSIVDTQVKVYPCNTSSSLDWTYSTTKFTEAQYNAAGSMWNSITVPAVTAQWVEFEITQARYHNCGSIVLRNQYEGSGNDPVYQSFASTKDPTNKPKIVVNWTSSPKNTSFDTATTMSLNSAKIVSIPTSGSKLYYSFTPTETGFYTFESRDNGSYDPLGALYNSSKVKLVQDDDKAGSSNFRVIYHLHANQKYYFEAGCYGTKTGGYALKVYKSTSLANVTSSTISTTSAGTANIASAYGRKYFSFTPSKSGSYTIVSSATTGDPYGWLYDSSGKYLISNDDNAGTSNFSMTYMLTAGQKYYIVAGCTGSGTGNYSVNISSKSPKQPTNLAASNITGNSVKLTWSISAPHNADRWLIQYRRKNADTWINKGTSTSLYYTVSGLDATTEYEFRVYSETGSPAWSGTWSAASNITTAKTLPAQPTNVKVAEYTDSTVRLTWETASPHGADRWLIQCRKNGGAWENRNTTTYPGYSASGLEASATYEFRVYSEAGNSAWNGTKSLVSNTVSVKLLPAQPTNVTVSSYTDNRINLTWNSADPHGCDRWVIECRKNSGTWYERSTTNYPGYSASGLDASATYEFRVYAERDNADGTKTRSWVSNTVSAKTLPAQPTDITLVSCTDNRVHITWSTAEPHGCDRWVIQCRVNDGTWSYWSTSRWPGYIDNGLTPNTKYEFRVYAERDNADGSLTGSPMSNNTVTVSTLPAQPTGLTISGITANSLYLSWSTVDNHGADRWLIQYRKAGGSWTNIGISTSKGYTVKGLSAGTAYEFRVYSEAGPIAWDGTLSPVSDIVSATTLPAQPTGLSASDITENSVKLTWNTVTPHGADRWLIQYRKSGGSWINMGTSTSKEFKANNLDANTVYEFRVYSERGVTAWSGAWSSASATISVTTKKFYGVKPYVQEDSKEINCLGYAFFTGNKPTDWYTQEDHDFWTSPGRKMEDVYERTKEAMERRGSGFLDKYFPGKWTASDSLSSLEPLNINQWIVCMRIGYKSYYDLDYGFAWADYDYHYWYRTNTGEWANKHGQKRSESLGNDMPTTDSSSGWALGDFSQFYNSPIRYYRVSE